MFNQGTSTLSTEILWESDEFVCSSSHQQYTIQFKKTKNTVCFNMEALSALCTIQGGEAIENCVVGFKNGTLRDLPVSVRMAMAAVFGDESKEALELAKVQAYDYSHLSPSKTGFVWELVDYRTLKHQVRRGEPIEFLKIESPVYLNGDSKATKVNRAGNFDPAADTRMRSLVWIDTKTAQGLGYLVLVMKKSYIWRHQYLYEIAEFSDERVSDRLDKLLYSRTVEGAQPCPLRDHIIYNLKGHKLPELSGYVVEGQTSAIEPALQIPHQIMTSGTIMRGMGVMVKLSAAILDDELPLYLEQVFRHFSNQTGSFEVAGIVRDIKMNQEKGWDIVIGIIVTREWISQQFFYGLYHQDCFSSNLEIIVSPHEIIGTMLISPALLYSSAAQVKDQVSSARHELIVKGHLEFSSPQPTDRLSSQSLRLDVCTTIIKLLQLRYAKRPSQATEFFRVAPIAPYQGLQILCWRAFSWPSVGPAIERFRHELGQNFWTWAHGKTARKIRQNAASQQNVIPVSIPGRILMALVERYVTTKGENMRVEKDGNCFSVIVKKACTLRSLFDGVCEARFDKPNPNWNHPSTGQPQQSRGNQQCIFFDFNDIRSDGNCADGSVYVHSPILFKWQMYPKFSPIDIIDTSSEGTASMACSQFDVRNVSDVMVGFSMRKRFRLE